MAGGIYVQRGATVSIPSFSLRFASDGQIEGPPLILHVRTDVCPTWIKLAVSHSETASEARAKRDAAWPGTDEVAKAATLEEEFDASMQAIMAAAIAWDALYAMLVQLVSIPPDLRAQWRRNKTARYSQVSEVISRAVILEPKGMKALRQNLKTMFGARDLAVHPSADMKAAVLHPELDVGMEWRVVYFRATNAATVSKVAAMMLWDLAHEGKPRNNKVESYLKTLALLLQQVFPLGRPTPPAVNSGTTATGA